MEKKNVAVVFGGVSSEHGISLISATTILEHLDREKYRVYPIGITREGRFLYYEGGLDRIRTGEWEQEAACGCVISPDRSHHGMLLLRDGGCETVRLDCVIPALHGKNGEDGTIQGLLELSGIPFVGCGVLASAACMDKAVTHTLLDHAGIRTARFLSVREGEEPADLAARVEQRLGWPVFVKPANAGSSYGVSRASGAEELEQALREAFRYDRKAVIEEEIVGQEVECAVLGNADAAASTVGEIESAHDFYDFESKYEIPDSQLHIPARLKPEVLEEVRRTAVRAYHVLGCEGLCRVDFFVTAQGEVILNEPNTLPGFTSISMYPKLWEAGGLPIPQQLDRLIGYALERPAH